MSNSSSDYSLHLFHQGKYYKAYEYMGSHKGEADGISGVWFRVWAPNAKAVSVVGSFNFWDVNVNKMQRISDNGVWEAFVTNVSNFDCYRYAIEDGYGNVLFKSDPC